jgi:Tol biopolymer transport system component
MPGRRLVIAVFTAVLLLCGSAAASVALLPLPAAAPGHATLSQIDGPGLYVVGADGRGLRRVASGAVWPSWSPDGRSIAAVQGALGDVVVVDVATGAARVVASGHRTIRAVPSWSPDSGRIAYPGPGDGWDRDIWIADATASGPARRLARSGDDSEVAWGPDGRLATVGAGIVISEPDGSNPLSIPGGGNFGPLKWSPDGTMLVNLPDSTSVDLIINADGSNPRMLADSTRAGLSIWEADWSPTSGELVYYASGYPAGPAVIGIAPADGSAGRALVTDARDPAWSPRGDLIGFITDTGDGGPIKAAVAFGTQLVSDLEVIALDGSGRRTVVRSTLHLSDPAWSADGTMLAFVAT